MRFCASLFPLDTFLEMNLGINRFDSLSNCPPERLTQHTLPKQGLRAYIYLILNDTVIYCFLKNNVKEGKEYIISNGHFFYYS